MLLPIFDGLVVSHDADVELRLLADRHYSRGKIGASQFVPPGRKLVIRNTEGTMVFAWHWPLEGLRMDGEVGYCCSIFRNESLRSSSEIILECEQIAFRKWGVNRVFTYVDPLKISSKNPGYCFKMAGWKFVRVNPKGLHLLEKLPHGTP